MRVYRPRLSGGAPKPKNLYLQSVPAPAPAPAQVGLDAQVMCEYTADYLDEQQQHWIYKFTETGTMSEISRDDTNVKEFTPDNEENASEPDEYKKKDIFNILQTPKFNVFIKEDENNNTPPYIIIPVIRENDIQMDRNLKNAWMRKVLKDYRDSKVDTTATVNTDIPKREKEKIIIVDLINSLMRTLEGNLPENTKDKTQEDKTQEDKTQKEETYQLSIGVQGNSTYPERSISVVVNKGSKNNPKWDFADDNTKKDTSLLDQLFQAFKKLQEEDSAGS